MRDPQATIKMVRRCRLNNLIIRHENRVRERSRLYQLRQQMRQNERGIRPDPSVGNTDQTMDKNEGA